MSLKEFFNAQFHLSPPSLLLFFLQILIWLPFSLSKTFIYSTTERSVVSRDCFCFLLLVSVS